MPKIYALVTLMCTCLLLGTYSPAHAFSPEPLDTMETAAGQPAPKAAPKARPLSEGEREVLKELSRLRTERLKALRTEMHQVIDRAAKEGKITQEQAQLMKQHRRMPKHLRRHGQLPEAGNSPHPTDRVDGH